jgi:hypothetical protein
MYNLLIHGVDGTWNKTAVVLDLSRYLEYTTDPIIARFKKLDDAVIAELTSLPALFAYEAGIDAPARLGRIKMIQRRQGEIRIAFEFDNSALPVERGKLHELEWELDFGKSEMGRTHWAVKDVDLLSVLAAAGISTDPAVPLLPVRRQLLEAADILSNLSHSGFDRMLLEFGIDHIKAGRDGGGLASRANALAKFALDNPDAKTVEGVPIGAAILNYARRLGWSNDEVTTQHEAVEKGSPVAPERSVENLEANSVAMATSKNSENVTSAGWTSNNVFLVHGRDAGGLGLK